MAAMMELQALQHSCLRVEDSPTSTLSNTLVITEPNAHWLNVQKDLLRELGHFGTISRLDATMAPMLRMVSVSFFDVRSCVDACSYLVGRGEHVPPTGDDFRLVLVNLKAFQEQVGSSVGFSHFGEVASVSTTGGSAILEFYDIRSALALVAAAGGSASPCTPQRLAQQVALLAAAKEVPKSPAPAPPAVVPPPGLEDSMQHFASEPPRMSPPPQVPEPRRAASQSKLPPMRKAPAASAAAAEEAKAANRPTYTKISSKDFSKYDVEPWKISAGKDLRTTVMVRNLVGQRTRKDFLKLLERCGLEDRYTFFYMPCKEHRDTPAGFAFVNLTSAMDVLTLHSAVVEDVWRTSIRDMQAKPLALSYARFQGHEELMAHFSSSAVLSEQDPEKRPLFCNPNKKKATAQPAPSRTPAGFNGKNFEASEVGEGALWAGA